MCSSCIFDVLRLCAKSLSIVDIILFVARMPRSITIVIEDKEPRFV